jgi:hypothetical protein
MIAADAALDHAGAQPMIAYANRLERLSRIIDRIAAAGEMSPGLWAAIVSGACERAATMRATPILARLNKCAADGAWVDAALALIDVELAGWKLRRIVYEDGEWYCALSPEPCLPEWLDGAVEVTHRDLALALTKAALETMREVRSQPARRPAAPPLAGDDGRQFVCCDNF